MAIPPVLKMACTRCRKPDQHITTGGNRADPIRFSIVESGNIETYNPQMLLPRRLENARDREPKKSSDHTTCPVEVCPRT
jgi:hypothetical protein